MLNTKVNNFLLLLFLTHFCCKTTVKSVFKLLIHVLLCFVICNMLLFHFLLIQFWFIGQKKTFGTSNMFKVKLSILYITFSILVVLITSEIKLNNKFPQ